MKSDRETGFCCQGRMSGYYSKKVAAPTPKGTDGAVSAERYSYQLCRIVTDEPEGNHLSLEKYLETLYWSRPATFVKEKVNRKIVVELEE